MKYKERLERIESFAKLEKNWDSYQADPVTEVSRERAKTFAVLLDTIFVAPRSDGGVEFESQTAPDGSCVIFGFLPNGLPDGVYIKTPEGEWEVEWNPER